MKTRLATVRRSYLTAGLFLAAIVLWLLSGLFAADAPPPLPAGAGGGNAPVAVRVMEVEARTMPDILVVQGRTMPERSVTLRAETSGRVVELGAPRGHRVAAGDPILRLDEGDRPARLAEARAQVAQRRLEWEAAAQLGARDFVARTRVAEARAQLEEAEARLAAIEREIRDLTLRAPFAGILERRPVEIGDFVPVGEAVATLVELDPIRVVAEVTENSVGGLSPGLPARAVLTDGRELDGIIVYVAATATPETRTFPVEMRAPNPGGAAAGLTAELRIAREGRPAHAVPASALTLDEDGRIGVKTVEEGERVAFHPIRVIGEDQGSFRVTGLPGRTRVIVLGQDWVRPGQEVTAVPAEPIS